MTRPRVLLLGTGGAANECRYQACLLVERADRSLPPILLDTGDGLDVVRALLTGGVDPRRVRDIFVSHRHADHMGGLNPLLLWQRVQTVRAGESPTAIETRVYAEPRVLAALGRFFEATGSNTPTNLAPALRWMSLQDGERAELPDGGTLAVFLVDHEPPEGGALGCVVDVDGVRLGYSGDTRPSDRLVEACQGVDILFHEAGGLDAQADAIHRGGHSTAGDAGRAARAAGAQRLYLTHLPDDALAEPMLVEARVAFGGDVGLAVDQGAVEV
ncbi:MAG: ribonuclease Z [Chloroflexi bacterium]|nr:ribonuclease Z [Chloroflexota bacterium]